ncbi:hypothetical protein BXY85_0216 [Roseivirga pacifica]|uniref:Tetratricopeptide repeat-containing protein n=1 Tax=Roseivirga pacifica TaxID=1267423 RepID=A0A1I0R8M9_9BACT|nr:hypothetical protein [Roseivirga pacifica]MCO6358133.1 hypothetical protein [Roseivirga pacifica]MCO6366571.1 hypothetical protein [Roseivirga pacifica]MCO6371056.1 hypothetical protein [Roseivirga pacifica]MCO6373864.1 hypothetical protein [Roseivirga pacifica]MCO6380845.1 hypothetical protein [Roseivirga pacifica]
MQKLLPAVFLLLIGFTVNAQRTAPPDPLRFIDTAVVYMDNQEYEKADEYYMTALEKIDLLSADFCFFFGKNSFYLGKYTQSIDWLNKYLELKGSRGQHSKETMALLDKAEEAFRNTNNTSTTSAETNSKFFYRNTIDCTEGEAITCPLCRGQDVIITLDKLGERLYRTCPYSTNGVLTCKEYNLLIQGLLKPKH